MDNEYDIEQEVKQWIDSKDDSNESALLKSRVAPGNAMTKLSTAIADVDKEYRQSLLLALFENKQEAMLAAGAISERLRYGVTITPIVDRIAAECATKGARVSAIIDALTHNRVTTNNSAAAKAFWDRDHLQKSS